MKRIYLFFAFGGIVLLTPVYLPAQSNGIMDRVLEEDRLSCGHGAYLALTGAGLIGEGVAPDRALEELKRLGWIGESRNPEDPMRLGEYSKAIMEGFSIRGGIMYTLTGWPRYASRELSFLGYITRDGGAYRYLSGAEAVSLMGMVARREK